MDAALWDRIAARAASQYGTVTTDDLRGSGATDNQIKHLVRSGRLRRVSRRVFIVSGSPRTWDQRAFVAVADSGGLGAISFAAT